MLPARRTAVMAQHMMDGGKSRAGTDPDTRSVTDKIQHLKRDEARADSAAAQAAAIDLATEEGAGRPA